MKRRMAATAILILMISGSACTRVGPGHVGIKVNMAGSERGVSDYTATTGWVFYNPAFSSVLEYPTFEQNVVWTANVKEGNPSNEEITFTNKDQMAISVDISLSYHLETDKVPAFYVRFRNDDLTLFTHGYLHNLARDKFNDVGGSYDISQIMGDNGPFLKQVKRELQTELTPLGVIIGQFGLIGAPRPPEAVKAAINAKVEAVQSALRVQNQVAQARAEADKEVAQAEGRARAVTAFATAQAEANRKLAESLTENLIRYETLKKWDGKLPQVSGGATPFLNLGK